MMALTYLQIYGSTKLIKLQSSCQFSREPSLRYDYETFLGLDALHPTGALTPPLGHLQSLGHNLRAFPVSLG